MRRRIMLLVLSFHVAAMASAAAQLPGAHEHGSADTLSVALAAARWFGPSLPSGRVLAVVYGTSSHPTGRMRGLALADAQAVAAELHAQMVVHTDSVVSCTRRACPAHPYDVIVSIVPVTIADSAAIVMVMTVEQSTPFGEDHMLEVRFVRRGATWAFDRVLSQGAS